MQSGVQEIAGTIPGKHSTGSIRTVRARRQTKQEQFSMRIAESWDALAPIGPVAVGPPLFARHLFPVCHQTRTLAAGDNFFRHYAQRRFVVHALAFKISRKTTAWLCSSSFAP